MITSVCTVCDEKDIGVNAALPVCKQMPKPLYLFEVLSCKHRLILEHNNCDNHDVA